jgi:hypothetical protein
MNDYSNQRRIDLVKFIIKRGYQFVGQGHYAAVFRYKPGMLVKVYGELREEVDPQWGQYDPLVFYHLAKKINNKFVPWFGNYKQFKYQGKPYTVIPTEELSRLPPDKNLYRPNDHFAFVDLLSEMTLSKARKKYPDIEAAVKKHGYETFNGFYETVEQVCHVHPCQDLFQGDNVLWRENTPVINDPWVFT